ncbi:MAG: hypothetical protein WC284_09270 [Candidimonas sp.]
MIVEIPTWVLTADRSLLKHSLSDHNVLFSAVNWSMTPQGYEWWSREQTHCALTGSYGWKANKILNKMNDLCDQLDQGHRWHDRWVKKTEITVPVGEPFFITIRGSQLETTISSPSSGITVMANIKSHYIFGGLGLIGSFCDGETIFVTIDQCGHIVKKIQFIVEQIWTKTIESMTMTVIFDKDVIYVDGNAA